MVEPKYHEVRELVEDMPSDGYEQMPVRAVLLACLAGCVLAVLIAASLVWWGGR